MKVTINKPVPNPLPPPTFSIEVTREQARALFMLANWSYTAASAVVNAADGAICSPAPTRKASLLEMSHALEDLFYALVKHEAELI